MNAWKWVFNFFRCRVAPLKKETDRYERLPLEERTCHICIYILFVLFFVCLFVCILCILLKYVCCFTFPFLVSRNSIRSGHCII